MPVFNKGKKLSFYPRRKYIKRYWDIDIGYTNIPTTEGMCPCFVIEDDYRTMAIDTRGTAYSVLVDEIKRRQGLVEVDYSKEKRKELLKKREDIAKSAAYRRLRSATEAMRTLGQINLADKLQSDIDILMA